MAAFVEAVMSDIAGSDLEILEVGCGTGWMCSRLAARGHVTGIDLSDDVLARARVREPRVKFIAGDFMSTALPAASFDVVVTLDTLNRPGFRGGRLG